MSTFEINIQRKSGNHWPIVVEHSRPGELLSSRSEGILALTQEDFEKLTSLLGQPKDYGTFLGKALFQEEIRDAFVSALRDADATVRVLLFIEAEDPEIRTLRWERLCGNIDDGWHLLSLEQRTPYSLYIPAITDRRFPPIGRRDLRALILVASPEEIERYKLDSFDVEAAVSGVRQALGTIPCDVLAPVSGAIGEPTLDELCKHLTDRTKQYTLLHFVSHSRVIDGGETVLYWAKAENKVDPITGTRLIERLRSLKGAKGLPHFTFLSTCESASPEAEAALGGLGQRLVRDLGMPAVIAMTEKVTVKTALALGAKFYEKLGKCGEVDLALQEAAASLAERQDITVPALFSRLGGRPLFSDQLDRDLTNSEIQYGLEQLEGLLKERSPILLPKLQAPAATLANLVNLDYTALSKEARREREQALEDVNDLSVAVLDLSFNAIALGQEPPIYDTRCPFLGLYPFRVENQKFFFGREKLIIQLQQKLEKDNFLAIFGASGSGKSSVVLAGLIPALTKKQPDLHMAYMTPNSNPIEQLQASFLEVQNKASVLVIDQFEELFTLCTDEQSRILFIEELLVIVRQQKVVITMRADFWGECASYPQLKQLLQFGQELIGPMDTSELRKSMEMQAAQVGLRFEAGLSNQILDDVQGEPGAMPLLQHALLELWKRRHGRWLRIEEYEAIGGVKMAMAQTADAFYDSCIPQEQEQVKNIFIRLTRLDDSSQEGEKRRDTRRRVWLEELIPTVNDQDLIKQLLKRLAGEGARLVVTNVDSATQREEVEVAHEALIRYWPRLLKWLEENRSLLLLREKIRQAALDWENNQKDESYLVPKGRLEAVQELLQKSHFLNVLEANYVKASVELCDRQQKEQEARRRRESRKNLTIIVSGAVILTIAPLGIITLKSYYEAELSKADSLRNSSLLFSKSDKDLPALVAAIKSAKILKEKRFWSIISGKVIKDQEQIDSQFKVIAALQQAIDGVQARNYLTGYKFSVKSVVFSPDGKMIATTSNDNTVKIWDLNGNELTKSLLKDDAEVTSVVFSPDGKTMAILTKDNIVKLQDLQGNKPTISLPKANENAGITSLVFSPNGKTMVTASVDHSIIFWDFNDGTPARNLLKENQKLTNVVFSPNGKTIATVKDNTVKLWNLQGKQLTKNPLPHLSSTTSVVFSPDGKTIATMPKDKTVKLWDLQGNELTKNPIPHVSEETSVVFSPDSKIIATVTKDNTIKLWNLQGNELTKNASDKDISYQYFSLEFNITDTNNDNNTVKTGTLKANQQSKKPLKHNSEITTIAFSPDGETIATGSEDNSVILWDLNGNQLQTFKGHDGNITSLAFSPDGSILASASKDNSVILWNLGGKLLQTWKGHQAGVTSIAFSPDGKNIASASKDNTVKLWDLGGKVLQTFTEHKYAVTSVAFSPYGQVLASASEDKTVKLWDVKANFLSTWNQEPARLTIPAKEAEFTSVVFAPNPHPQEPNCEFLAAATKDNNILLWDLGKNQPHLWDLVQKQPQTLKGHKYAVTSVAFSPDCQTLASASVDNTIILWDLKGNQLQTLRGHKAAVTSVAFSPDGKKLASGSDDKTIIIWDLKDIFANENKNQILVQQRSKPNLRINPKAKKLKLFRGHQAGVTSVAFSPDGDSLASGSLDNTVIIWDLNGKKQQTLRGHQAAVNSVAFSRDGKTLASASDDHTIKLWDLDTKHILTGHQDTVNTVKFSRDGKTLASGSDDNTVRLWDLKGNLLKILKGHKAAVISTEFIYDDQTLTSEYDDDTLILWDFNNKNFFLYKPDNSIILAFSPDGQTWASVGKDNMSIQLENQNKKSELLKGHEAEITNIVFSPNSKTLVSVSQDNNIELWNLQSHKSVLLKGHEAEITNIVFSRDGKTLASASKDKTIKLWDLQGNKLANLKGHEAEITNIVFSRDGKTLASASKDKTIKLWDLQGNKVVNLTGHKAEITKIVLSPDGKTLASVSEDKTIKLWDLQGNLKRTLIGHDAGVKDIAFSPDGYTLASGSADNNVMLWDLNDLDQDTFLDDLMVSACNSVGDYLHSSQKVEESDQRICDGIGNGS